MVGSDQATRRFDRKGELPGAVVCLAQLQVLDDLAAELAVNALVQIPLQPPMLGKTAVTGNDRGLDGFYDLAGMNRMLVNILDGSIANFSEIFNFQHHGTPSLYSRILHCNTASTA